MTNGFLIKIAAAVLIVVLWAIPTVWAVVSLYHLWRIKEVDPKASVTLFRRAMLEWIPNPFAKVVEGVREKSKPTVRFSVMQGLTFTPQGPGKISSEFFVDRKQYSLTISTLPRTY